MENSKLNLMMVILLLSCAIASTLLNMTFKKVRNFDKYATSCKMNTTYKEFERCMVNQQYGNKQQ